MLAFNLFFVYILRIKKPDAQKPSKPCDTSLTI